MMSDEELKKQVSKRHCVAYEFPSLPHTIQNAVVLNSHLGCSFILGAC